MTKHRSHSSERSRKSSREKKHGSRSKSADHHGSHHRRGRSSHAERGTTQRHKIKEFDFGEWVPGRRPSNRVGEQLAWDFQNVNITRVPGYGFGIAVSGGRDNPHFSNGDPAIAISDVLKAGPAEAKLMINDRIVSANGISLENVDYATAVQVLRECGNSVNLVIKRKINTNLMATAEPQTLKLTITRGKKKEDFGVVLGCHIYIKEVTNSNLIDKSSSVQEGDIVLKINNTNTENISLKDAKKLIDSSKEKVQFVVKRDPNNKPTANHENQRWSSADFPSQPGYIDGISSPRPQWSNQNLYVQPPTRGDYRPPPPPPDRGDDKNNLTRLPVARNRGPIMDISLSQLDQPATPLLAGGSNSRPLGSLDEEDAPPRPPPPPRIDEFSMRNDMYDEDPLSRRSKAPLLVNAENNHASDPRLAKVNSLFSPDPRFIFFQKDGSVGIRLTGGNEVGIFVTAVQPGSPASLQGLQPGDKILKVNEKDMRGVTREEAVLYLLNIQDQVNLIVQHRKEEYDEIVANQRGDSFYIRTHFTYECYGKSELAFHVGEVFHVIDTLYNGVVGSWMVYRMGRNNQEIQKGVIPNKRRAEELSVEQQNQAKKEAASESRGSFFKRRSRRSKSLSKDNWEDVVFADGMSKFPAYERVTLRHPGFIRPVVLFGPLGDVARDKLLKDYPDKYASPQLDNRLDDIPKSQKSSGIVRLSAIKEIIEKGKHAILDITPSAVDRLNYAQFYPIVIFMKAENKHTVKELRSRLAKSSHKSSKKLYDHATKLEKLWSHVFTATIALTSADMWYKKLRETIEKQQQQAIWVSESKPQEVIGDDFLFPMTSRLSYASSPESDLDLTSDTRPMSLPDCLTSSNGNERRMVKASSDPSIATQEDASYNAPPPPYSLARPMPEPISLPGMGHTKGRDSISSPKHSQGVIDDNRTEDFYGSSIRTPHDRYGSLSATEKHLSQANGDVPSVMNDVSPEEANKPSIPQIDRGSKPTRFRSARQRLFGNENAGPGWQQDPRDHQQVNPDYMNTGTSKSSSLERSKLSSLSPPQGNFDNSSYSSDSFSKYMNNQLQATPDRRTRDSINSASMVAQNQQRGQMQQPHNPYRYSRSTNQWAKPVNSNQGRPQQPPPPNKYRQPEEKPVPPSPPPKPSMYHSRLSDGRPVPPPKPALFQQRQQWHPEDNRDDHNFKRASQAQENIPISPRSQQENQMNMYTHGSPSRPQHPPQPRDNNDYNSPHSPLYSSRNYGSHAEPPPRPQPPPVPENPYQSRHQPTPGRRPFHQPENGHRSGGNYAPAANHRSNYEISPYHKSVPGPPPNGDGYSPQRPVAHVNGTTSYHHSSQHNSRREHHSYHSSPEQHHSSPPPPAPASLLDLSNRENRGSAFELYKKPDSRSSHSMPLHLNCDTANDESQSASPRSNHQEEADGEEDPTRSVVAVARGRFDHQGGTLTSEETGVSIIVPAGAINEGEESEIYFKVCQDSTMLPPLDKDKGETLLSPLVMCGPHGQKFNIPVELRLPHSAAVNPESWSFALKSSDATEGAAAEWQNTSLDSGGTFSRISDNFVSVLVDHF